MADKRWYVVPGDEDRTDPNEEYWTVSLDPKNPGWETDMGCPGYGLTKALAEELANAANLVLETGASARKRGGQIRFIVPSSEQQASLLRVVLNQEDDGA